MINVTTDNSAVNWMISKANGINGALNFNGTLNSRMVQQIKNWFDTNGATYRDGSKQSVRNLHYNGFSFVLKSGSLKSTQNTVTLWVEAIETDPDQAEFVNWWVI